MAAMSWHLMKVCGKQQLLALASLAGTGRATAAAAGCQQLELAPMLLISRLIRQLLQRTIVGSRLCSGSCLQEQCRM